MRKKDNTPDYRHGTFSIASTDILNYEHSEFVSEWLENHPDATVADAPSDNSREFWDWAADLRDCNWDSDLENIECCRQYNTPCVITGSLGLWNGRRGIVPVVKGSVIEALRRIFRNDCDDWDVSFTDGHIEVKGHHHDGTNTFYISALSKKGVRRYEAAERRYEDYEPVKGDIKRLPYLYAVGVC